MTAENQPVNFESTTSFPGRSVRIDAVGVKSPNENAPRLNYKGNQQNGPRESVNTMDFSVDCPLGRGHLHKQWGLLDPTTFFAATSSLPQDRLTCLYFDAVNDVSYTTV